jgi:hypothetical protein
VVVERRPRETILESLCAWPYPQPRTLNLAATRGSKVVTAIADSLIWKFIVEMWSEMILDLPIEILSEILVLLDYRSILHSSAVIFPILIPLFLLSSQPSNRFAHSFMPSLPRPSISNIASSLLRRDSSMGHPEVQHRRQPHVWTSFSSDE